MPEKKDGLLFISVESYYFDMVPANCYWTREIAEQPTVSYQVYHNNKQIDEKLDKQEMQPHYTKVKNYEAGDKFRIEI